jgi:integrase
MAKKPVRLTKTVVEHCPRQKSDVFLWDAELKGFGVRVWPSGRKTFIAKYRVGGGRNGLTRRFTIGTFGTLTVDEARAAAKKVLAAALQGSDPSAERTAKRREMTIAGLISLYGSEGTYHLKERNRRWMLARLQHHIVPSLGRKKITDVRVGDVEQMMRDVKAGKTAKDERTGPRARVIVRGGSGAATKAVRDLSAVFNFAIRRELVPVNPCAAVRKPADAKRKRFLTLEEVVRFGKALENIEAEDANPKATNIMRLWVLTGCRRDEIAELMWSEVDFEASILKLEDTKTGFSVRPMASAARAILLSIPRDPGSPYVFPSETGQTFYQGTKRFWAKVVKQANLPGVTPHSLRHTIGSAAVSTGETLAMTGALLGHADQRSTSIYAHMQQDPARRAVDRVVGPIATALASGNLAVAPSLRYSS